MKLDIIRCTLSNKHHSYPDTFLLKGSKNELDVDLTGDYCFNEFDRISNEEFVATVSTLEELVQFIHDNNLQEPYWTDDKKCIRVGGEKDMIIFPDLSREWASETDEYANHTV